MASYYVWSGAAGSANGTSWANAYTTLTAAFSGHASGDVYYVAHDHLQTAASAVTLASNGNGSGNGIVKVICVDRAGTVPPVSADRRATARVETTGNFAIHLNGSTHYDGIIFSAGTGASGFSSGIYLLNQGASDHVLRLDNCALIIAHTAADEGIRGASSGWGGHYIELNNTTMTHASVSQVVRPFMKWAWRNTPSALLGTIPNTLFSQPSTQNATVECTGVDLSAAGSGKTLVAGFSSGQISRFRFIDCKTNASVTKSAVPSALGSLEVDFIRSGATGINYAIHSQRLNGLLIEETTIVRTGGASDGTTPISWKVVTTANCNYSMPFECPVIAIWNDTTGSAVTATVECRGAAILNDDEIWLDVEYLGDASSPQGSFVNDGKANLLATAAAQTSSSETWGGSTASYKLNVSFTAQMKGWIYARVKVAKVSTTVYVDPLITLT